MQAKKKVNGADDGLNNNRGTLSTEKMEEVSRWGQKGDAVRFKEWGEGEERRG